MRNHIVAASMAITLVGCTHYEKKTVESTTIVRHEPPVVQQPAQPEMIDLIIGQIRNAPDARGEALALTRLQEWMAEHDLTFQVSVTDTGGHVVNAPSSETGPLNVLVSIYQQRKAYRDFRFTPRDNRNLAILGA